MSDASSIKRSTAIAGAVILAAVFTGVGYGASRALTASAAPGGRAAAYQGGMGGQGTRMRAIAGAAGSGMVNGILVKKDGVSFSVKQRDGSMKLALITSSTKAMKMTEGALSDVAEGSEVMITGTSNADGSLTAQIVQLRPAGLQGNARPDGPGLRGSGQQPIGTPIGDGAENR